MDVGRPFIKETALTPSYRIQSAAQTHTLSVQITQSVKRFKAATVSYCRAERNWFHLLEMQECDIGVVERG